MSRTVRFIDLFAGMGGMRIGFEQAFQKMGFDTKCVFTSEIKTAAVDVYRLNFPEQVHGDITQISVEDIEDFDFLLAGFPCQAFSTAGKQKGFADTRGTLFFEVERILKAKKPYGFILENVEGLVTHDRQKTSDPIGRTLSTILNSLCSLGYSVSWRVLNAKDFGIPQSRKRIYITGVLNDKISLEDFTQKTKLFREIQEHGLPTVNDSFTEKLLCAYTLKELYGKKITDKRGGQNNIHSWDIGLKGILTQTEKLLLEKILKERRKKHWAAEIGIDWMDGMPLTLEQIRTFYDVAFLKETLNHLVQMGYLSYEHPKKRVLVNNPKGKISYERVADKNKQKGYNIVSGKLSFKFNTILEPESITPTLTATDMEKIGVIDGNGIRNLTLKEGLALFGYPSNYSFGSDQTEKRKIRIGYNLLGNTVCVPVIEAIAERLADKWKMELRRADNGILCD